MEKATSKFDNLISYKLTICMYIFSKEHELAAAALLNEETQLTPPLVYHHFSFSPDASPEVEPEMLLETQITSGSSDVSAHITKKLVRFSLDTKTEDATQPSGTRRAAKRRNMELNQKKPPANDTTSQDLIFDSYPTGEIVQAPIFTQSQAAFSFSADTLVSGRTLARSKSVELSIGSNIPIISNLDIGLNANDQQIASSGSSFGRMPVKKSLVSRRMSTSDGQRGSFDLNPSLDRTKDNDDKVSFS